MARQTRSKGSSAKKSTVIKVDFTGVESSGNVEEGRQLLTVKDVELKTSENTGNDYLNWQFKAKGGSVYHTTSLQPQALWNLRNVLEALGQDVEEAAMEIDYSDFIDMTLGAEIAFEKYNGKNKPVIVDLFKESELDGEEAEDPDTNSSDEPTDISYEEVMEMDKDELLEIAEDNDIKVGVKVKRDLDALRELVAGELGLEPSDDGKKDSGGDDLTYEELAEMSKDELLEVAEENDIKVGVKVKRDPEALLALIAEELELEPAKKEKTTSSRRKTGTKEITKGATVVFEDDGEELEGVVKSVNTKEQFAVLEVEGEEWEVELSDIKVK